MPLYEEDSRNPYVRNRALRYPKAGTANPEVSLRVVDLQGISKESPLQRSREPTLEKVH